MKKTNNNGAAVERTKSSPKADPALESNQSRVVLERGGTFQLQGQVFVKGEQRTVPNTIAEKLLKTGFFARR